MSNPSRSSSAYTSRLSGYLSTITPQSGHVPDRSTVISVAVACLAVGWIAVALDGVVYAVGGIVAGSIAAIAVATISNGSRELTIGGLLVLFGSLSIAAIFSISGYTTTLWASGLSVATFITGFGLTRFRVDAFGDGALARVTGVLIRITTVLAVLAVFVLILRINLSVFPMTSATNPLSELLRPTTTSGTTVGFVILAWLVVAGEWILTAVLPPETAVPDAIQNDYNQARARLLQVGVAVLGVGSILLSIAYLASVETRILIWITEPTLGAVLRSPLLRTSLVRLFGLLVLLAGILLLAKSIGVSFLLKGFPWTPAETTVAAGLFALAIVVSGPTAAFVQDLLQLPNSIETISAVMGSTATGLLGGVLTLFILSVGFTILSILAGCGLLPSSTAGPRIAMWGLFFTAAIGSVGEGSTVGIILCVVAGIVVYDLGVFGGELTAELGLPVSHPNGELIHAAAMLVIGVVALVGGLLIDSLVSTLSINDVDISFSIFVLITMIVLLVILLYLKENKEYFPE